MVTSTMTDDGHRIKLWCWSLAGLTFLVQAYLILSQEFVPLYDLPNHMARHYLEALALAGEPLPPFYDIHYQVLPNLGATWCCPC